MPLHIVQRGHNRDACFFGEDDYSAYRHWLAEALNETGCVLQQSQPLGDSRFADTVESDTGGRGVVEPQGIQNMWQVAM